MTPASIAGFRLIVDAMPPASEEADLAALTIEHGPWIISGWKLCSDAFGRQYLKPPRMRTSAERVVLRSSPERTALLAEAKTMLRAFLATRIAAPPLATAPNSMEPSE